MLSREHVYEIYIYEIIAFVIFDWIVKERMYDRV